MKALHSAGCGAKNFILDTVRGIAIGVAFIIPGFSGGSVAAILGIYERLVNSIADIFKSFKESVKTLLPIALGMVIGILGLLYPLGWALEAFPIPTVTLFVGLALGGLPSITDKLSGKPKPYYLLSFLIPFALALGLSLLPIGADVDLFNLNVGGYVILFIIGVIGSAALVVPGISGSMILLILGYYNPIVDLATNHFLKGKDVPVSILVLGSAGLGIIFGFILISIIMKHLLKNHPRGTHFAILGFILGSIPTVFISTAKESGLSFSALMPGIGYWIAAVLLLIIGIALSLSLIIYSKKKHPTESTPEAEA